MVRLFRYLGCVLVATLAFTASTKCCFTPAASSTFSAASVVPPFEVTWARKAAGSSPRSMASLVAPTKVHRASDREAPSASPSERAAR